MRRSTSIFDCLFQSHDGKDRSFFKVLVEEAERIVLQEAMQHHGGQMAATARALSMERSHLYKKCKALGLRDKTE